MQTEMITIYVQLRKYNGFSHEKPRISVSDIKRESCNTFAFADLTEMEIAVPKLTENEKEKIMQGAELEALIKMKEELQAETHRKLMQIDERIGQLQALDLKE